jgi:hypothetical protein
MSDTSSEACQRRFRQHLQQFAAALSSEEHALLAALVQHAAGAALPDAEVRGYALVATGLLTPTFLAGLVTDVGLPALDGGSKDAASLNASPAGGWHPPLLR